MGRTVKDYDERYDEFLRVAAALFYSKGYEPTSVQEIIRAVGVAKGTFYHYFDSKVALLEALVTRQVDATVARLAQLVALPDLDAAQKFTRFFQQINDWKLANKPLMLETARVLFQDENVLLRAKMRDESVRRITPLLGAIIAQGQAEGVFDVEHPHETAVLVFTIAEGFSNAVAVTILAGEVDAAAVEQITRQAHVFHRSVERVLGAAAGSLYTVDPSVLAAWLD